MDDVREAGPAAVRRPQPPGHICEGGLVADVKRQELQAAGAPEGPEALLGTGPMCNHDVATALKKLTRKLRAESWTWFHHEDVAASTGLGTCFFLLGE